MGRTPKVNVAGKYRWRNAFIQSLAAVTAAPRKIATRINPTIASRPRLPIDARENAFAISSWMAAGIDLEISSIVGGVTWMSTQPRPEAYSISVQRGGGRAAGL